MCDNEMTQTVEDASAEAPKKVEACEAGADRCCRNGKRCCKKDKKCRKCPEFECNWDYMCPPMPYGRRFRKRMMKECMQEECGEDGKYKIPAKEFKEFKAWQKRYKKRMEWIEERKKNKMFRHGHCHPCHFWRHKMWHKMMCPTAPQPMHCGPMGPRCRPCDPRRIMMLKWMRMMKKRMMLWKMMDQCPMPPHHRRHCHRECGPRHMWHPCMEMMGRCPLPPPCFGYGPWHQWGCPPPPPPPPPMHRGHHHGHRGHWGMPPHAGFDQWGWQPAHFGWERDQYQWW